VFGVAGAWAVGERLGVAQWAGAVLVVASVAVITIRLARAAPAAVAAASAD